MKSGISVCFYSGSFSCMQMKLPLGVLKLVKKGNIVGPHNIAAQKYHGFGHIPQYVMSQYVLHSTNFYGMF
jgi:hypothetical protein